jgi:hypothetical protein
MLEAFRGFLPPIYVFMRYSIRSGKRQAALAGVEMTSVVPQGNQLIWADDLGIGVAGSGSTLGAAINIHWCRYRGLSSKMCH